MYSHEINTEDYLNLSQLRVIQLVGPRAVFYLAPPSEIWPEGQLVK